MDLILDRDVVLALVDKKAILRGHLLVRLANPGLKQAATTAVENTTQAIQQLAKGSMATVDQRFDDGAGLSSEMQNIVTPLGMVVSKLRVLMNFVDKVAQVSSNQFDFVTIDSFSCRFTHMLNLPGRSSRPYTKYFSLKKIMACLPLLMRLPGRRRTSR